MWTMCEWPVWMAAYLNSFVVISVSVMWVIPVMRLMSVIQVMPVMWIISVMSVFLVIRAVSVILVLLAMSVISIRVINILVIWVARVISVSTSNHMSSASNFSKY